ncbi:trypsin-like peptidase domain-containing protein [Roseobacter sinensis]|uniref:Serine protease n=1 Tax=Roseobacter sinensis TaxID=2931391 RepID=A0ABT3BLH9_9RHOB|nr:trypsin-like peptidase domain-containing protein [Roseobacter sp. WL0113]MCV3274432.1 trypsin-like peptidase domain-containing protein [Roseobacter sp. WL0113]
MTFDEFRKTFERMLKNEQFEEAESLLEKHARLDEQADVAMPFQAPVVLRQLRMGTEPVPEGQGVIDAVTRMSRRLRNARYARAIEDNPNRLRVLEEGDSWYQYPVFLRDIIDHVAKAFPVYSLSAPGDLVSNMALNGEYIAAIRDQQPDVFLLSGAGNDVLGSGRFRHLLLPYREGAPAEALLDHDRLKQGIGRVMGAYEHIVSTALGAKPDLQIFLHGYDHVIPRKGGGWLGRPLAEKGIPLEIGQEIVKYVLDRFNQELVIFSQNKGKAVHYVDLRGKVGPDPQSWEDELHPTSEGYGRCAEEMITQIRQITGRTEDLTVVSPESRDVDTRGVIAPASISLYDALRLNAAQTVHPPKSERQRGPRNQTDIAEAQRELTELVQAYDQPEPAELVQNRLDYSLKPAGQSFEATIGENNFDEFFVLPRGARVGHAVARIHARRPGGGASYGTGFLIGGGLLMTNNHVLSSREMAEGSIALFNYQYGEDGAPVSPSHFRLRGDVFLTSVGLDYSIVQVEPASTEGTQLDTFGFIELLPLSGKALKKEFVNIIQHPSGDYKKVSLRENVVVGRAREYLYYVTDTMPGSSGSPVLNEEWQLTAIHHMAIPDPSKPGKYRANRGVRISSILADIAKQSSDGSVDAARVQKILEALRSKGPSSLGGLGRGAGAMAAE